MNEIYAARVAGAIASFDWDDFGLNDVQETIREGSTEWIKALASRIAEVPHPDSKTGGTE